MYNFLQFQVTKGTHLIELEKRRSTIIEKIAVNWLKRSKGITAVVFLREQIAMIRRKNARQEYLLTTTKPTWERIQDIENLFENISKEEGSIKEEWDLFTSTLNDNKEKNIISSLSKIEDSVTIEDKPRENTNVDVLKHVSISPYDIANMRVVLSPLDSDQKAGVSYSPCETVDESKIDADYNSSNPSVGNPGHIDSNLKNVCTICDKQCSGAFVLARHLLRHSEERPFTCPQCKKTFKFKEDLKRHEKLHSEIKPYCCNICNKTFIYSWNLKIHSLVHSGAKPHSCDTCHKTFRYHHQWVMHRRVHSGDRPYECGTCDAAFATAMSLKRHMTATHDGIKPYCCNVCQKSFSQSSHLKRHLLIHSGEKPFQCSYDNCNKRFAQKYVLKAHMDTHTAVKPRQKRFFCPVCEKGFTRSTWCKAHIKRCEFK